MEFTGKLFLLFVVPFFGIWFLLVGFGASRKIQNQYVAASSGLLYALGYPPGLLLLVFNAVIAWLFGRFSDGRRPSAWLTGFAVVLGLLPLFVFKYYNFFIDQLPASSLQELDLILPVGISFYTFTLVGYLIDVRRGEVAASASFVDCFVLIAFWPHLAAGPILRAQNIFENLRARYAGDRNTIVLALVLIVGGAAKKLLIADNLGAYVNRNAQTGVENLHAADLWATLVGFAGQIYADFSAYSEMAIGFALLLGFRLPANFNYPYRSRSIGEFWRRWHISLSTWFRDYVFIPLGGSRVPALRVSVNLLIVFLISGLWHGAGWGFIIWGGIHGTFLVLERAGGSRYFRIPASLRWLLTLFVVLLAWAFFRFSPSEAFALIGGLFDPQRYQLEWDPWSSLIPVLGIVALVVADHCVRYYRVDEDGYPHLPRSRSWDWAAAAVYACVLYVAALLFSGSPLPFIYFAF